MESAFVNVDSPKKLREFARATEKMGKHVFCDLEGDNLGRKVNSTTSIQVYCPKTEIGYYIDVLTLKEEYKDVLNQVVKPFFEDSQRIFFLFDPVMDEFALRLDFDITVTGVCCMRLLTDCKSMQHLVETESGMMPWEYYSWSLEKHLSRLKMYNEDYSSTTDRPVRQAHLEMAMCDVTYLHVVYELVNPSERKIEDTIEQTMAKLQLHEEMRENRTPQNSQRSPEFRTSNLNYALGKPYFKYLACGYVGTELKKGNKSRAILNAVSRITREHLFNATIESALLALANK